jgi:hypothetical protein
VVKKSLVLIVLVAATCSGSPAPFKFPEPTYVGSAWMTMMEQDYDGGGPVGAPTYIVAQFESFGAWWLRMTNVVPGPNFSYRPQDLILTSTYEPRVASLPDGKWAIVFVVPGEPR